MADAEAVVEIAAAGDRQGRPTHRAHLERRPDVEDALDPGGPQCGQELVEMPVDPCPHVGVAKDHGERLAGFKRWKVARLTEVGQYREDGHRRPVRRQPSEAPSIEVGAGEIGVGEAQNGGH